MNAIGPDIWHVEGPGQSLPGGVRMPLCSTVIRLPDRSLLVYSPIAFDAVLAAEVDALGDVAYIVAPNVLHHLHVGGAAARWPRARIYGAPSLAAKRPDLTFHGELGGPLDPELADAIAIEVIGGAPKINEAVLFHHPSGTLACADLVFNVTRPANLRTRFVLALVGAGGRRLAQSRVWRFAVRDRAATRVSLDRVLAWPITCVAPAHGERHAIDSARLAPIFSRAYGRGVTRALAGSAAG